MSTAQLASPESILLISGVQDDAYHRLAEALSRGGASVDRVSEIYAAMAILGGGKPVSHLVVDIRWLDDYEMQFLKLAPRYFKQTRFVAPVFDGVMAQRGHVSGRYQMLTVPELLRSVLGENVETPIDDEPLYIGSKADEVGTFHETTRDDSIGSKIGWEGSAQLSAQQAHSPSTQEPSLHDAVRQRMAGDGLSLTTRVPPGRIPPHPTGSIGPTKPSIREQHAVTPEERTALFSDTVEDTNRQSPPRDTSDKEPAS